MGGLHCPWGRAIPRPESTWSELVVHVGTWLLVAKDKSEMGGKQGEPLPPTHPLHWIVEFDLSSDLAFQVIM